MLVHFGEDRVITLQTHVADVHLHFLLLARLHALLLLFAVFLSDFEETILDFFFYFGAEFLVDVLELHVMIFVQERWLLGFVLIFDKLVLFCNPWWSRCLLMLQRALIRLLQIQIVEILHVRWVLECHLVLERPRRILPVLHVAALWRKRSLVWQGSSEVAHEGPV